MLSSKATQFTLSPLGEILWQEKLNNPLPGVPVARLKKGDHPLRPVIEVIECKETSEIDANLLKGTFVLWLNTHLQTILEPLVLLGGGVGENGIDANPVAQIAKAVYDGLGIVPRENLEEVIAKLDTEKRADLRAKKIRLGPILVFIPALNKPAAVKLRALLWSLYHDSVLPAAVPSDGMVSYKLPEGQNPDPAYYRAIGYPLYGGRAIRIDMLDRVISCVYDNAKDGKFQAKHEMAEWLGASIEGLYSILSDMGHVKIFDPAENQKKQDENASVALDSVLNGDVVGEVSLETTEVSLENAASNEPQNTEEVLEQPEKTEKVQQKKPELATFRLKRGKAFERKGDSDRVKKPRREFVKKVEGAEEKKAPYQKKKDDNVKKFKDKKGHDRKKDSKKSFDDKPRVISYEVKKREEDSPFAILQQLKKSDG